MCSVHCVWEMSIKSVSWESEKWVSRGFRGSLESVRNGYLEGFRGVKGADKAASPNWRDFALVSE